MVKGLWSHLWQLQLGLVILCLICSSSLHCKQQRLDCRRNLNPNILLNRLRLRLRLSPSLRLCLIIKSTCFNMKSGFLIRKSGFFH